MWTGRTRALVGTLVAAVFVLAPAAQILAFSGGVGDGDRSPSTCNGCHGSPGAGAVSIAASSVAVQVSDGLNITVTVNEPALGTEGIAGVFILKGPVGTGETVTADGWTIVRDPNGAANNYAERTGLATGVPVKFVWALTAPPAPGNYSVYAQVVHGGGGPASEISAELAIAVAAAGPAGSAPPVITAPSLPQTVPAGSALNVSARITDDLEGVESASVLYKAPGGAGFTQKAMTRLGGTALDGLWTAGLDAGQVPGALELYITATDGKTQARCPANGSFSVSVVAPGVPEISAPSLPASAQTNSTVNITARIRDVDNGVALAVLRYRPPGSAGFTVAQMRLVDGTAGDGLWAADAGTGPSPGVLELWLEATDGEHDARSPAAGQYAVQVAKPPGPALDVFAPASITFGDAPAVRARVSDASGVAAVEVRFRLDSEAAYRTAVMGLANGTARDGEYTAMLPPANATGEYLFIVVARNARSDSASAERAIKVLPDLSVSGLAFSKKGILVKQVVEVTAIIRNAGDRPATGVSVSFLDQSYHVGDMQNIRIFTNLTVPANGQLRLGARWVPQVEGARDIAVVVDPDNKVAEGNETNNMAERTVPVGLEPAVGVRIYIPTLGDIWVQLTVVLVIGAIAIGLIARGAVERGRRRTSRKGGNGPSGPGGKPGGGG
jgi:hypothetical protein